MLIGQAMNGQMAYIVGCHLHDGLGNVDHRVQFGWENNELRGIHTNHNCYNSKLYYLGL